MKLVEVIRATKVDVEIGKWETGHITRSQFPLSQAKNKNYKFGPDYRWRVVRFRCLGHEWRVLLLLCAPREIFRTTLAVEVGGDLRVVCQHEYHASEPGWHCHLSL
ncbi:hypothetical protein FHP25_25920 [Vineibacter terrae]|uniref:Uncharacterized protein n=1 Tax=Vineibacter terrae TaxID=2586908 RepID=A0A5C8PFI7_9HYPH|nr:hypothetical protein [Vineibacter terrae]TXL72274.1 hypothetical protein FHP25_25920 [Vineibacter terrae]